MARRAGDLPAAPIVVTIEESDALLDFDDWLRELADDEPVAVDVRAAELISELREHGDH